MLCLCGDVSDSYGAERVLAGGLAEVPPADAAARAIADFAAGYSHIAAVSSMESKDILARVAGRLDAAMVTDAVAIESPTVFVRPMLAGAVLAHVEALGTPIVLTVRPAGFGTPTSVGPASPQSVDLVRPSRVRRLSKSQKEGGRPDLAQAKVVVSGGRPLKDAETFERVIGRLADRLGGAVGATRAAVDAGIAPNELQVGQTGKIVAPDLYIAAGISGSTQHMAGIKDSKTIVAINTDPDAPIFEIADLGLVADLFQAIPEIESAL
jgi:electron transfer flavoprotein alpha subunit